MLERYPTVRNTILNSLPPEDFAFLRPHLSQARFKERALLQEQKGRVESIGFVESGLVSLRRTSKDSIVELALVSNHGIVGSSGLLGSDESSHQCIAVTSGLSLNIRADELSFLMEERPRIKAHLLRNVQALLIHCSQVALCGLHHQLTQRLASWLCHASDAAGEQEIPVTQEYLSMMLGLRRASVAEALSRFDDDGLIVRARGSLRVQNRAFLDRVACSCYSTMSDTCRIQSRVSTPYLV
jgi:CRP-like cAMP-binding protein